jgi:hypothetical protein
MAPRSRRTPGPVSSGRLARSEVWAGVHPGDPVEVDGTRLRSATWAFVAHVRNTETGEEWIEVVGGRPGDHNLRSFRPEQVYPPRAGGGKSSRPPSLAQAPRLPLG